MGAPAPRLLDLDRGLGDANVTWDNNRVPFKSHFLICKVSEEVVIENVDENCRCRQPHCRLTPLPRNPRISPYTFTLYCQSLAYILPLLIWVLSSFTFFVVGS